MLSVELSWGTCSCGFEIESDLLDAVYPLDREKTVYQAICDSRVGGCGRVVYSYDLGMLNKRWNIGVEDANIDSGYLPTVVELRAALEHLSQLYVMQPIAIQFPVIIRI
ncbi:hypothetical protein AB4254_07900 [Vibrio breoganii]